MAGISTPKTQFRANIAPYLKEIKNRIPPNIQQVLAEYTHTANQEIYINAIDYTTGIVTTTTPHGLTGTNISNVGVFVNGLNNPATFTINNVKTIPYEYVTNRVYITVVNASQLKITNSSGGVIAVNTTSASNNGNLDISKWHIEILQPYSIDIPNGHKRISVEYFGLGLAGSGASQYTGHKFWENGNIVNPTPLPNLYDYIQHSYFIQNNSNYHSSYFSKRMMLNLIDERIFVETWSQNTGRTSGTPNIQIGSYYRHTNIFESIYASGRINASGIAKIQTYDLNVVYTWFSNGTKIKVYKL